MTTAPAGRSAAPADELGAHVSVAGGVQNAPGRAAEIGAANFQLFTKQPNRWAEPKIDDETTAAFKAARAEHGIAVAGAHDSYLINLSTPDGRLWRMSQRSFQGELERCARLGLEFLVTHPGNATDGDIEEGLTRNARGVTESLEAVEGPTRVLLELTAGAGTTVGASFENLRAILDRIPESQRDRVGVCLDTCHAYSAGYDLVGNYDGVWEAFDEILGLELLGLIHMNDSKHPFDSRKDRHEEIGAGSLGEGPFRRLMRDVRLRHVPKILETPKGGDGADADIRNLARLRSYREGDRIGQCQRRREDSTR
ncbi:deoxyribonuclease IV [Candidatus Palauibacter sp.]|uniref:deoxyribonuclease IV n=1 Tax=Candidatus Palauibacter sp. TaxID=3101350 RepID=UPI003B5194E6